MTRITLLIALCTAPLLAQATPTDAKQAYIDATFTAMDANNDGRVDKAEYAKFQQERFSKQADSIGAAFSAMDRNKDGRISKEEANVVPEIAKYFAGLDTDADCYLSLKEMQQAMVAAQTADAPTK